MDRKTLLQITVKNAMEDFIKKEGLCLTDDEKVVIWKAIITGTHLGMGIAEDKIKELNNE